MTEQMAEGISTFDELVARIATQPVEVLARAIAKQAGTLGASIDWNGETTNQLSFYTAEALQGLNLPPLNEYARDPVRFWRSMAT